MVTRLRSRGYRLLVPVSVFFATAGCGGSSTPAPYTNEAGNYRVLTVGSTKNSQQKVPSPAGELNLFAMENIDANKTTRTVIYTDYPVQLMQSKGPEAMLEGGVRGMGGQWNIESQKPIVLDGHPGRELQFSLSGPNVPEKGAGRARLYLVGSRLYQVIIVGPASKVTAAELSDFVSSFELLRKVAVAAPSPVVTPAAGDSSQVAQARPASAPAPARSIDQPVAKPEPRLSASQPGSSRVARAPMPGGRRTARRGPARTSRAPSSKPANTQPNPENRIAQVGNAGPDPTKAAEVAILAKPGESLANRPEPNGNERDRFREVAREGAVLVGARVGYIDPGRDQKVGMIQPIFQTGSNYVSGKSHGKDVPPSITVVARPGYAVGAINTRTGLFLDAFQFVFMKFDDGQLDPSDSYTSDWLGDPRGGGDGKASGDGNLVVGIHGRTSGREVDMLGLVVAE